MNTLKVALFPLVAFGECDKKKNGKKDGISSLTTNFKCDSIKAAQECNKNYENTCFWNESKCDQCDLATKPKSCNAEFCSWEKSKGVGICICNVFL